MFKTTKIIIFFLIFVLPLQVSGVAKSSLEEQRENYVLAEKLIAKGEDSLFFKQIKSIKKYPLYPYIQYQWLVENLDQKNKVQAFLNKYSKTRYARPLKYKWQIYLAKKNLWTTYIKHYKASKNTKLQCNYLWARYKTGYKTKSIKDARKLWVVGRSQPKECDPIFKVLTNSPYFTNKLIWQRFRAALSKGNVRLAKYIRRSLSKAEQKKTKFWLKIHAKPSRVENIKLVKQHAHSHLIFAHGIERLARRDIVKAVHVWDSGKKHFKVGKKKTQFIERKLAMALALDRNKTAYSRLNQLPQLDEEAKQWRVRAALRSLEWVHVKQSIAKLSKESKEKERWKYWLARSLDKTGQSEKAKNIYAQLAKERSYYGYLSADKLKKKYQLANNPVQVSKKTLDTFKQKTDFRVVAELIEVNQLDEAKRQWWYSVNKLSKAEILVAAKYAQQLQWKQIPIYTIAKAKYWDDVPLRFPLAYQNLVNKNAELQNLNPAVIYGLIRRESAFNETAQSPVGARGLMQIMPRTGRQIARNLKEKWHKKKSLFDPEINLKYGSYYYKKMLNKFNGNYVLAAAAYNAGPHRVKRWLPEEKELAADIWIETIPYKETRGYVSAVLTYALIYQKQLKQNILTMDGFMGRVFSGEKLVKL